MLCIESHVAYGWLNGCCFHGCCGAWRLLTCSWNPTMCQGESLWKYREDTISQGLVVGWHYMASCGITMCRWIAGIHPRIRKFPQICKSPEIIEIWVTAFKLRQLCKACCHFIKPASLHYTQPSVLNQDEVQHVEFSLGYTACRLEEGDQLRLHVCSAAHPRWLRHPLQPRGEDWLLGNSEVGRTNMLQDWWNGKGSPWTGQYFHVFPENCPF